MTTWKNMMWELGPEAFADLCYSNNVWSMRWLKTCISVEIQMLSRCGKCFLMRSARRTYSSNSTTFISHALSPILTCMLSNGLGNHGLWLDHTKFSMSNWGSSATCRQELFSWNYCCPSPLLRQRKENDISSSSSSSSYPNQVRVGGTSFTISIDL